MNTAKLRLGCYAVVAAAQLGAPAWMIVSHEETLRTGQMFKFRTMPVDPYDAFRGRYVWLQTEQNALSLPAGAQWTRGQKVFALIETGTNGFSKLGELRATRPDSTPYLTVRVSEIAGSTAYLRVPFDRYYMEEGLAPAAEKAYLEHSRTSERNAYITVRVRDGLGVIENLWIDGIPIHEFVTRK
jgi:uncharacterized membrane-anchored protein